MSSFPHLHKLMREARRSVEAAEAGRAVRAPGRTPVELAAFLHGLRQAFNRIQQTAAQVEQQATNVRRLVQEAEDLLDRLIALDKRAAQGSDERRN